MCSYDQNKSDPIIVESLKHLSPREQDVVIADKCSRVSQEYEPLKSEDITIPAFDEESIPQFSPADVQKKLEKVKTKKSVPPGDIHPILIKTFAVT